MKFTDLSEKEQEKWLAFVSENVLVGLLYCDRVWTAWQVGTMTQDDFIDVSQDECAIFDTAEIIYDFVFAEKDETK